MAKFGLLGMAVFCCALTAAGAAVAQDRGNPFVAPPSEAEKQALQDERMRNIVWELQPEIKSMIMQDVTAAQAALEIKLRRRIDTAVESVAARAPTPAFSAAGAIDGIAAPDEAAVAAVPEGSTFISCVNGKALYRDTNNTTFLVAGNGVPGSDRCAN